MVNAVEDYIARQKSPQKEILQKLRKIFHSALTNCEEKAQWGVIGLQNGKFYLAAMKSRVHVGFAISGLSKEELTNFDGAGKTMRHIKINSLADIDEKQLAKLIKLIDKKAACKPC